ncbi:ABC transporter ATP-binding protein [Sporosarcina sp. G11-34]|uniref:ABC transporter ATP-binding protein n=1 Tax=Sporosarcina sp. G11-34 TaxID=2849605 RepID=UPI0022A973AF|nr:ABC transporter ATP-binding protein [Sporosarcina sp. G11-34]MCZ2258091.1 ABC transporter ATP-binding protein [Sporosarcina sp. G11-34]
MNDAVTMSNVHKTVDDFQLKSINLEIERGTISALIGKNGAGKSTLIKMIMNLMKSDEGDIQLLGQSVSTEDESWKTNIAYLPQKLPLTVPFTGHEMKELILQWYPSWDEHYFQEIVSLFGVDLSKKMKKLSPGVQQQLNLALVLARNTPVLILDEPTAHLDIPSKQILNNLLIEWMDKGERTIILATHQIEDIQKLADYLVVLKGGKIRGQFEKEELTDMYKRYWFSQPLECAAVPGEVERKEHSLTTKCPIEAEDFLLQENIRWTNVQTVALDEIITMLLV